MPPRLRLRALTRWAANIRAARARPCPSRRIRRSQTKAIRREAGLEKIQARVRRRLARAWGPLGAHNADSFLAALDAAKAAGTFINDAAVKRLHGRRGLAARTAPRPKAPAVAVPRAAPAAPGEGPSAQGPPGQGEDGEDSEDGEPPPPPARARRKGRGRPQRSRRFRACPDGRTYRKRLQKLDSVARALEGDPDALFLTLVPLTSPSDRDRRLAAVPQDLARAFAQFAARLRRAGATYAMVVATRAENSAFWPHAHAIVAGVPRDRLAKWAAKQGFSLHAGPLRNPRAAVRYMARAGQKAHFDGILGARGFHAHIPQALASVSPRNTGDAVEVGGLRVVPGQLRGLELAPGQRVVSPAVFLAALAQDLKSDNTRVRAAARHRLALLQAALAERGPP